MFQHIHLYTEKKIWPFLDIMFLFFSYFYSSIGSTCLLMRSDAIGMEHNLAKHCLDFSAAKQLWVRHWSVPSAKQNKLEDKVKAQALVI